MKTIFIVHGTLVLVRVENTIKWMQKNNDLHQWLLLFNELKYGTPYPECLLGNKTEFMPLYNSLNGDILYSLNVHCILSLFVLKDKGHDKVLKKEIQLFHPEGNC